MNSFCTIWAFVLFFWRFHRWRECFFVLTFTLNLGEWILYTCECFITVYELKILKKLSVFFLWMGFICLKAMETIYFLPISPKKLLVLIWLTWERWKADSTLEKLGGFEPRTPVLGIRILKTLRNLCTSYETYIPRMPPSLHKGGHKIFQKGL